MDQTPTLVQIKKIFFCYIICWTHYLQTWMTLLKINRLKTLWSWTDIYKVTDPFVFNILFVINATLCCEEQRLMFNALKWTLLVSSFIAHLSFRFIFYICGLLYYVLMKTELKHKLLATIKSCTNADKVFVKNRNVRTENVST